MDHGAEIRRKAVEIRSEVCRKNGLKFQDLLTAEELSRSALDFAGLDLLSEHPESNTLQGALAVLDPVDRIVYINDELEGGFRWFCVAHEIGHQALHNFKPFCKTEDIEALTFDDEPDSASDKVIGYGPNERKEREANLFAIELLLPCAALRKAFAEDGLSATEIAERTGMQVRFVNRQLARAVLIPDSGPSDNLQLVDKADERNSPYETSPDARDVPRVQAAQAEVRDTFGARFELNPSQRKAVQTEECPVLVSAGPGTGKTETLIRRIVHLLEKGADPRRILALTFSNKATQEMRERIAEARPEDASHLYIFTFHSFGYNLLMKYWEEAGIAKDADLLDQIDALLLLEKNLSELDLEHYLVLYDPMRDLPDVLTAISRAKDELCGPARYREFAEAMLADAEEDDTLKAEKAIETARIYKIYQRLLEEHESLDFGDLIMLSVRLLRDNLEVREKVRKSFDHVLVDEFQDVNRASGVLLRLVAGKGDGLWAVGDLRQSIYRWRGASPENIRRFEEEYEGAKRLSLETNYRSVAPIVRTFSEFGRSMIAREPFNDWEAFRGEGDKNAVSNTVADEFATEALGVAERAHHQQADGNRFKDQAVICRTHGQLAMVSSVLAEQKVPVFYLGQLFEREEIRDLLSLLELASADNCHALMRVGQFAEYGIPEEDILPLLSYCEDKGIGFSDLDPEDESLRIADASRKTLGLIRSHLEVEKGTSAYDLLSDYLLTRSRYLRGLISRQSVSDKQKQIAIYKLLGFASSVEDKFEDPATCIRDFLGYIKRLVMFREQKNLAEIPAAASGLDAVRLLTVHGAKGLEFDAVYLPFLAAGKFPTSYRGEKCPTPPGLRTDPKDDHIEEEECLFFVASSRARDRLHLSRSINYSEYRKSKPSPFLTAIEDVLPEESVIAALAKPPEPELLPPEAYARREFYAAELDRYLECPRQYFYRYEAGLKSGDNRSAYQKLHGAVFETLRLVQESDLSPAETKAFAVNTFERLWQEAELDGHAYADLYRTKGEELVEKIVERFAHPEARQVKKTIPVPLSNGVVKVSSDSIEETGSEGSKKVVARNVKTGKQPKNVETKDADAALLQALKNEYPDAEVSVAKVYLTDDSEHTQNISEKVIENRLKKYEDAIDGINRGEFEPNPSDRRCPTCAYYFICQKKD
ncbi:MAG: ImmA/IrrE family metallo-endopeptidase [Acidobacteria bacterium]|nr:MAG: ImmA/IrrE family metallo-endopeptidase [Acidobacteriota bacterium]REJ98190.1 MAG: ImmA/IrrE family metallo-endopeptidase [Acidobacteriota bacterium]REK16934.1 MAG: ImmA/IrrE family metallo-endopeptidase [Acidobacteriota bacterium]REK42844.1 MAG: ImmA/IrrE family metallo-endopeptidase [Acidobacteriota bacterium]